jgi:hypothetical protein
MDRAWGIYGTEIDIQFWSERDHFIDQGTDGRILSKHILKKQDGRLWTGDRFILMPQ